MKRGTGIQTAQVLGIHPSTVSRNKERIDVMQTAANIEYSKESSNFLTQLNKTNDIQQLNSEH